MPIIHPYKNQLPRIDQNVFLAENAALIGDVSIGSESSIWYGCVLRADVAAIKIGQRTNIQDGTVIHESSKPIDTIIGNDVTVGHMALLHACHIGNGAFIGMKACVMDGAVIEENAMVAAGALVTPGKVIPSGQLWGGSPTRYMRDLTEEDFKHMKWSAEHYVRLARDYLDV